MNTLRQLIAVLLGLALVCGFAFGGYATFEYAASFLLSNDMAMIKPVVLIAFIMFVATWTIASGIRQAGRRNEMSSLMAEKFATYRFFLDTWTDRLTDLKSREEETVASFKSLDRSLALYACPAVIEVHAALYAAARTGKSPSELHPLLATAVAAMRKDLGTGDIPKNKLQSLLIAGAGNSKAALARSSAEAPSGLAQYLS